MQRRAPRLLPRTLGGLALREWLQSLSWIFEPIEPEVPVRPWVLTLPCLLRYRCRWKARLASEVLQSFLRAVFADHRRRARVRWRLRGTAHCNK
jgi:hypothetical protein